MPKKKAKQKSETSFFEDILYGAILVPGGVIGYILMMFRYILIIVLFPFFLIYLLISNKKEANAKKPKKIKTKFELTTSQKRLRNCFIGAFIVFSIAMSVSLPFSQLNETQKNPSLIATIFAIIFIVMWVLSIICWIVYYFKIKKLKKKLEQEETTKNKEKSNL